MLLNFLLQIDIGGTWIPPIASLVAFAAILTITWNISRKITTLELLVTTLEKRNSNEFNTMEKKHLEDVKALEAEIQRQVGERKDDMLNETIARKDALSELQTALTNIRSQLKDVDNRVTIVDTIVKGHAQGLKAQHKRVTETQKFFETWTQRVEDRVTKSEDRCFQLVQSARTELMGMMNMLINAAPRTRR